MTARTPPQRPKTAARMALVLLPLLWMNACGNPPARAPRPASNTATNRAGTTVSSTNAEVASVLRKVAFEPLGVGRDPFFPTTTRAPRKAQTNEVTVTARPQLPLSSYLKLTGLWPVHPKPLAFINKTDFRPGEQVTLSVIITNSQNKAEAKQVSVRCVEIRRESVVISVEGEPGVKELRLP